MTKVTVNRGVEPGSTPTAQLVEAAQQEAIVVDSAGRTIGLKKPGVLAQFRLIETLGNTSSNVTYVNMVLPLIYVSSIDGDIIYPFGSKREIEALIQRLDEHGLAAVQTKVIETWGQQDPEAEKEKLKKP